MSSVWCLWTDVSANRKLYVSSSMKMIPFMRIGLEEGRGCECEDKRSKTLTLNSERNDTHIYTIILVTR